MDLSIGRVMLASAFCLALILQGVAFTPIPAQAQSKWTGTIETNLKYTWTEFDGTRTVEITRSADISFTVPEDPYSFGDITGEGTGSEEYSLHYVVSDGSGECPESYDQGSTDVTFELRGYVDQETGKAVLEMRQLTPYQYIVNRGCVGPYDSAGYYVNAFDSWNAGSFEIDLDDGAVYDQDIAGRQGTDRLVIHGSSNPVEPFDYEISVDPNIIEVMQDEIANVDLTVTLLRGKPEPVNVELYVVDNGARTHIEGYGLEDTPTFSFPYQIPISCEVAAGQYNLELQATAASQDEIKAAAFTINVKENPDCGPINPNECPPLTITPTMPPASDPRNIANPTGETSYRFQIAWEGKTPVKVNLDVQGGDDAIDAHFAINPANMQTSPINVLMDVVTSHAEEGDYPLIVDAWVIDSETGEECHAMQTAAVTLVVGESRATSLELVKRVGQVEIIPEETDDGGQDVIIETGDDGAATFNVANNPASDSNTTIDVGSNTVIKQYDHVDHFAKMMDRIQEDREDQFELVTSDHDPMKGKGPSTSEIIKNAIKVELEKLWTEVKFDAIDIFACLFAPGDSSIADVCSKKSLFYIWEGDVHILDRSSRDELIDRVNDPGIYMTDGAVIIPTGTDLTINVQQLDDSTVTTVSLLEGSALVVDLASEHVQIVNAGEKYYLETSFAGTTASSKDRLESQTGNSLVEGQFVEYDLVAEVESDDAELETLFEDLIDDAILVQFAGLGTVDDEFGVYSYVPAETASDVQWLNVTIIDNSPQEVFVWHEVKVKGKPVEHVPAAVNYTPTSPFFISTAGIGKGQVIESHLGELGFPSQLEFDRTVNLNIGGSSITAYEFSGTAEETIDGGTSTVTITAHYEKDTGMLVDYLVTGRSPTPTGEIAVNFGLEATKIAIPTELSVSSIPIEISQNSQLEVTGKISPPISAGQVVLVYQKDDGELVRKTVPVTNGAFSDRHMVDKDGTYAVSAEYLGAGAYLSSASSPQALTVTPSGCLIATAAYGSEFAPQVQMLRHIRDGQLMKTSSGSSFMSAFNSVYYSFSPTVAGWERQNPALRDAVRIAITPLIMTLSILPHVSMDSEAEALGYGIGVILLNIGIYFAAPALAIMAFRSKFKHGK